MRKISLLIHEDANLSAVAGTIDLFAAANWCYELSGKQPAFKLDLVSEKMKNIQLGMPTQFICNTTMEEVTQTDLIIIPGFMGDDRSILKKNSAVINWIREMNRGGKPLRGQFLFSRSGFIEWQNRNLTLDYG